MKKYIIIVLLLLYGCSGGGGGSSPAPGHTPSISNLAYAPQTVPQGSGGGAVTVNGSFDFIDLDGNVSTLTILVYDSSAQLIDTLSGPANISGMTGGTLLWSVTGVGTATVATYTFKIYVTDSTNLQSNMLTGTFSVT